MFDAIKRVISGEDVGEKNLVAPTEDGTNPYPDRSVDNSNSNMAPSSGIDVETSRPAIVESDLDNELASSNNKLTLPSSTNDDRPNHESFTPRSSLSDVSAGHNHEEIVESTTRVATQTFAKMVVDDDGMLDRSNAIPEQAAAMFAIRGNFPRNDSRVSNDSSSGSQRASSQNSSRDWGWFEDVHVSEHQSSSPYLKRKDTTEDKNNKKKGKRGGSGGGGGTSGSGLVPQVSGGTSSGGLTEIIQAGLDNDTAAMAVTAPNYVLEESLSSQKLWKHTAGNRPPQPVEERAFFEKMWAQNFARSQVQYEMPVEVLTATSPISLSPFADGNFDSARAEDLSNYNVASSRGDDHSKAEQDVAEATLISRLHDTRSHDFSAKALEPHHYEHTVINKTVKGTGSDGDLTVLVKGDNVFGTTVSKSFAKTSDKGGPIVGVDTVNISVASYRVVESQKHGKYAQFLVIYREGSIRDTIGVWKRYSDFVELSKMVTQAHEGCASVIANMSPLAVTEEHEVEHLPNAITSWRLLKKRQRWYRCLDAGYLSLKVFLLERFLHDILFESSSPDLLRDFVEADVSAVR